MIAEVINAEEYTTKTGRQALKITIRIENDIRWVYLAIERLDLVAALFRWCHLPLIWDRKGWVKLNPDKLKGKLIPVYQYKSDKFPDFEFYSISLEQLRL